MQLREVGVERQPLAVARGEVACRGSPRGSRRRCRALAPRGRAGRRGRRGRARHGARRDGSAPRLDGRPGRPGRGRSRCRVRAERGAGEVAAVTPPGPGPAARAVRRRRGRRGSGRSRAPTASSARCASLSATPPRSSIAKRRSPPSPPYASWPERNQLAASSSLGSAGRARRAPTRPSSAGVRAQRKLLDGAQQRPALIRREREHELALHEIRAPLECSVAARRELPQRRDQRRFAGHARPPRGSAA